MYLLHVETRSYILNVNQQLQSLAEDSTALLSDITSTAVLVMAESFSTELANVTSIYQNITDTHTQANLQQMMTALDATTIDSLLERATNLSLTLSDLQDNVTFLLTYTDTLEASVQDSNDTKNNLMDLIIAANATIDDVADTIAQTNLILAEISEDLLTTKSNISDLRDLVMDGDSDVLVGSGLYNNPSLIASIPLALEILNNSTQELIAEFDICKATYDSALLYGEEVQNTSATVIR